MQDFILNDTIFKDDQHCGDDIDMDGEDDQNLCCQIN